MKQKSLMEQWIDLKADFPRHIVLIQCGVFYETYQEDAEFLAEISKIQTYLRGPSNVAGFPVNSLDKYRRNIEDLGYQVVVVTEMAWDGNIKIRGIEYVTGRKQISQNVQKQKREISAEEPKKKAKKTSQTVQTAKDLKEEHKVEVALTQIGNMFNAFEDDAKTLSEKIGLKSFEKYGYLTVGFPINAKETYFRKILDARISFLTIVETGKGQHGSTRELGEVFSGNTSTDQTVPTNPPIRLISRVDHNSLKTAALTHAKNGFYIIPLVENTKRPLISDWQNRATTNTLQIDSWWSEHPNANIGIACEVSNLIIIDLDTSKGASVPSPWVEQGIQSGEDLFRKICSEAGDNQLFQTYTVDTPSGGKHLYFYDENSPIKQGVEVNGWWRVDTRSRGGYIVAEGSRILNDKNGLLEDYKAAGSMTSVLSFPNWLRELLAHKKTLNPGIPVQNQKMVASIDTPKFSAQFAEQVLSERCELIRSTSEGSRNQSLIRHATYIGKIISTGVLDENIATRRLLEAAIASGLTNFESQNAIKAGIKYGKNLIQ